MSDSEDNFNMVGAADSENSDVYVPALKKVKAKPATKANTTASKKSSVVKKPKEKKILKDTHDNGSDSAMDTDSDDDLRRSKKRPIENDDENALPIPNKGKSAHDKYQVLDAIQHILKRPDSYVGSLESIKHQMWVYDSGAKRMVYRDVQYSPAFLKIFDEILVNAADNKINDPNMDTIKVNIDVENNSISVYNNGSGIPILVHKKEKVYIPQMIFGQLLSSSNYDDDEKKVTGGRNGYGAKLTNIYSTEFTVETADKGTGQIYKQTWTDNMGNCGKAKITKNSKNTEYTRITFRPDLPRFNMQCIDTDTEALLMKRVYDMAGSVKDVKVWLNDERLKIKGFKTYVEMYLNSPKPAENEIVPSAPKPSVIYEQVNPRWEIACAVSESGIFQQISFANSICTTKGGTHVNMIADQIAKNLIDSIAKKNKGGAAIKAQQVKNQMWIFVNALVENPTFDSQTKDTLTLPASKFGGGKVTISEEFMKKGEFRYFIQHIRVNPSTVSKSGIVDSVLNWAKFKADQQIKKTDGTKRTRLSGLTKLSDANNAGGRNAHKCTLILTEGDSAKALAVGGLAVVGRDNFGVFPLRGKLLNVREARHDQIMKNEEIQNIKKIMGLQHNKQYSSVESLRYGSVMIMTDQDHDGSHIKGLIINFLDVFYPSLLKLPNFLVEFVTPIVRAFKTKNKDIKKDFFTIHEFKEWFSRQAKPEEWRMKYFKGLGTSGEADGREYFSNMERHMIGFETANDKDHKAVELAFSKKYADARKDWLRDLEPDTYLDHSAEEISISDFVNKELILFSMADNIRSIPSVVDGLKPVQRKVVWGLFKRNLKSEIKVSQLCGAISEMSKYHHGEESLVTTIVNLAQDYVGSNNVNLLMPNGQYGTRAQGGRDHASARYINTELAPLTRRIFHPADDPLLNYLVEEGHLIEPEWYMPILPQVLINGAEGIGTGWSTNIPNFNPEDVVANLRLKMKGEEIVPMTPWWRGFGGEVTKTGDQKWQATGVARKLDDSTVEITELPIHRWTDNFKAELEAMIGEKGDGGVKDYKEYHDNLNVHFVITMTRSELEKAEGQGFGDYFKLTQKLNTSNMTCFDFNGKIRKYGSPEQILEEFYPQRLAFYQKRKDHLTGALQHDMDKLSNQARFVQMIISKKLSVSNRKKAEIVEELRELAFRAFPKVSKTQKPGVDEPILGDLEQRATVGEEEAETGASSDYDYLLGMPIWSLTKEKIQRLMDQISRKEEELNDLLKLNPMEIWNSDLDAFLEEWKKSYAAWERVKKDGESKKRKPATLRTRKSVGKKKAVSDDSEDDFRPSKPVVKSRAKKEDSTLKLSGPPSTKKAKATKAKLEDSDVEVMAVSAGDKRVEKRKSEEVPSEPEDKPSKKSKTSHPRPDPVPQASGSGTRKTSSGKVRAMLPKSPPKPKQVTGKKPKVDADVGDDSDDEPVVVVSRSPKARRAVRAPAKYVDISSEVDDRGDDDDDSFQID